MLCLSQMVSLGFPYKAVFARQDFCENLGGESLLADAD